MEVILKKWSLQGDQVVRHVLEQLPMDELDSLNKGSYKPDPFNQWKSAAVQLGRFVCESRERKCVDGGAQDQIKTFLHRWKEELGDLAKRPTVLEKSEAEKLLRNLNHSQLRYVVDNFDGSSDLPSVI